MDPALLKDQKAFKKKALSTPRTRRKRRGKASAPKPAPQPVSNPVTSAVSLANYKTMLTGCSQYKFGVLAKIVRYMKARYQEGEQHALTLDEILEETNQLDVGPKVKHWLQTEALTNNPKLSEDSDGKFSFKAPYKIRDKKGLLRLLRQHDLKGLGGILLDDVKESLPHADKVLKYGDNDIIYVTRPADKKKVMFYNDRSAYMEIDDDLKKLWRSITVESMDGQKIEEHLEKQGIRTMQDPGMKKAAKSAKRKKSNRRKKLVTKPRDNAHMEGVLKRYDDGM